MARTTLDQVYHDLEGQSRYGERVKALRILRNRLLKSSSPSWVLEDEGDSTFPGCRLQVVFPGESKKQEIRVSVVAWDALFFDDLDEQDNWLEVTVVVGGHVREPVRCEPDDAVERVESLVRSLALLCY